MPMGARDVGVAVTPPDGGPAVAVRGLVRRYGQVEAVVGVDLDAAPGAVTAVLGPNGAGKTTTIECCTGLRGRDAGRIRVLGLDPATDGARVRPLLGVMLQDGGLPSGARVRELVQLVAAQHAEPLDVPLLLDRLGLTDVAGRPVRRLSGGQRQRTALAAAVVGRPAVAFLDEPTSGLDPQARHAVWDLVADLREAGVAVVLTTHAMDEAERLADHVVVIDHGRVVAAGSPQDLVGESEWVLRFRARRGLDLSRLLAVMPAGYTACEEAPGSYLVSGGELGPGAVTTITSWCTVEGTTPTAMAVGGRSLEDVFLELTGRALR